MAVISVIVPVYNVEKFLPQCIDSIIAQTFEDFDLILVDDGSTDNSGHICDDYAKIDSRLYVVHKKNEGAAVARNIGIENSKTPYITFIDSDDYIDNEYISTLFKKCDGNSVDLVLSGFKRVYVDGTIRNESGISLTCINKDEIADCMFDIDQSRLLNSQCCKIFRTDIIQQNHIRFLPGLSVSEDMIFSFTYFLFCSSICSLDYEGYYYRQTHSASLSKTLFNYDVYRQSVSELYRLRNEIVNSFNIKDNRYKYFIYNEYLNGTIWSLLPLSLLSKNQRSERISYLLENYPIAEDIKLEIKSFKSQIVYTAIQRKSRHLLNLMCGYYKLRYLIKEKLLR